MRQRKRSSALILAVLLLLPAGCAKKDTGIEKGRLTQLNTESQEDSTELSILYTGENIGWTAAMEELCEEFMTLYPDICIVTEHSNNGSYTEQLKAKEALGEFPDIFEIEDPYMFLKADKLGVISEEAGNLAKHPIQVDGKD